MLTLWITPGSSSMAPHIALHEAEAPFTLRNLSLSKKENRDPAFLAINPEGKVPTLEIPGRPPLSEVAGILFYVARRWPAAGLLPAGDVEAEARAVAWMSFLAAAVHPARAKGVEHATAIFKIAEGRLAASGWALDAYSIADIHLFRLFWRFVGSFKPARGSFPGLEAHYDRMMARTAVQKTIAAETAIGYDLPH